MNTLDLGTLLQFPASTAPTVLTLLLCNSLGSPQVVFNRQNMNEKPTLPEPMADSRKLRKEYGAVCSGCVEHHPNRTASILLPHQRCRVCGYIDPRKRPDGMRVATKIAYFIQSPSKGVYVDSNAHGTHNFNPKIPTNQGEIFWIKPIAQERLEIIQMRVPDAFMTEDLLTV